MSNANEEITKEGEVTPPITLAKEEGGDVSTRSRTLTSKGKQYKLDLHFGESKRIIKRLKQQKLLVKDLLQTGQCRSHESGACTTG